LAQVADYFAQSNDKCMHPGNLIEQKTVKIPWRKHLIICVCLGVLTIPVYFLDRALLGPQVGGGNWITLDFRGLIFWTYITLIAIHVTVSSIAVLLFPKAGALRIHLGSMVISVILLVTGVAVYGKLRRLAISNEHRGLMASRRPLMNVIELKEWWYFPDENDPTEIRARVIVHQSGRFAGNVMGEQTDSSGDSTTVFESTNRHESQRQVRSGEAFTYLFPLKFLAAGRADHVRITFTFSRLRADLPPAILQKCL
jgi:hypothetical protein